MKRFSLLLLLLAVSAGALIADRAAAPPSENLRYLDMDRCLAQYRAGVAEMDAFSEVAKGREQALLAEQTGLENRQGELQILDPASEQFRLAKSKFDDDIAQFQRSAQRFQEETQQELVQIRSRAFRQIFEAARIVGAEEGFSAIIRSPGPLPAEGANPRSLMGYYDSTETLWTNPNYDVTDLILKVLNGEG